MNAFEKHARDVYDEIFTAAMEGHVMSEMSAGQWEDYIVASAAESAKRMTKAESLRETGPFSPSAIRARRHQIGPDKPDAETTHARGMTVNTPGGNSILLPVESEIIGWLPPGVAPPPKILARNPGVMVEREGAFKCSAGASCSIHHPKKPEPFIPTIDEWDLLPDV